MPKPKIEKFTVAVALPMDITIPQMREYIDQAVNSLAATRLSAKGLPSIGPVIGSGDYVAKVTRQNKPRAAKPAAKPKKR